MGSNATNNSSEIDNSANKNEVFIKKQATFPVYCDGVYWGTAESVDEAIWMCNYDG